MYDNFNKAHAAQTLEAQSTEGFRSNPGAVNYGTNSGIQANRSPAALDIVTARLRSILDNAQVVSARLNGTVARLAGERPQTADGKITSCPPGALGTIDNLLSQIENIGERINEDLTIIERLA